MAGSNREHQEEAGSLREKQKAAVAVRVAGSDRAPQKQPGAAECGKSGRERKEQ